MRNTEQANQGWNVATDSGAEAASNVKPGDTVNINGDSASGVTVTNNDKINLMTLKCLYQRLLLKIN